MAGVYNSESFRTLPTANFTEKGVLLGYYGNGQSAGLADMPVEGRIEHVLTQASKVHPQMREEFETAYAVWWEKVPFSLGAYGRTPPEERLEQLRQSRRPHLYGVGGRQLAPGPGFRAPIQSAWRTVEALHERAMRA